MCFSHSAMGQSALCPPNLDFEQGNLLGWEFYKGNCCLLNTTISTPALIGRHTLTSGGDTDRYGGFPVVAPGGGSYSFKLGNNNVGSEAERARYYIRVPSIPGQYVFVYRYAVVLQDPGHISSLQPRFSVNLHDSANGLALPCNQFEYVASSVLPGFKMSLVDSGVYYKPWTIATIDLSNYLGRTIALDFATGDCGIGGHFGYAYFDIDCTPFQVNAVSCNNVPELTLQGPPGFAGYKWMDATFANVIDTTEVLIVPRAGALAKYAVIVTPYPGYGCIDTFYSIYINNPNAKADAGNDTFACIGSWFQLNGNGGQYYKWYSDSNKVVSRLSSPVVYADKKKTYSLVVTNRYGCMDTNQVTIDVVPLPDDTVMQLAGCINSSLLLSMKQGYKYRWFPADGLNDTTIHNPLLKIGLHNTYYAEQTTLYGCKDTSIVNVVEYPLPVAVAGNDTVVCKGTKLQLNANGGHSYLWKPGENLSDKNSRTPIMNVNEGTRLNLVVTNFFGCVDSVQLVIDVFPTNFNIDTGLHVCLGDSVQIAAGGGDEYFWLLNSVAENTHSEIFVKPDKTKEYFVIIKESLCNTADTLSSVVVVDLPPEVLVSAKDIDCSLGTGELMAVGATNYIWNPSTGLSAPLSSFTKASPSETTTYTVIGTDDNDCSDTVSVTLKVFQGDGRLIIPDVFTPNGDGINDCYRVFIPGEITEFELSIYNRFGERVFHSIDPDNCWNGNYLGVPAELSTYFLFIRATSSTCGKLFRKGNLHLVR